MSGFAVIFERSDLPGDSSIFNRLMERLSYRGVDGSDVLFMDRISMGHWHFWTTPEEIGERQPLMLDGFPYRIVLDGRLDNREELFNKLNIPFSEGKSLSDAALILRAYAFWKDACFQHFVGEFALVIFDEELNELVCTRDQLGDRTLFYASFGSRFVVASEPWAVVGARDVKAELNENAVAHLFAIKTQDDGQTFLKDVYELKPAHILRVGVQRQHQRCYWEPDLHEKIRYNNDEEYVEQFLQLLRESVYCRMRSSGPISVLMSGGLDSTSVACLAAEVLSPQQLTVISYVFDKLLGIDERKYIDAIKDRWNMRSIQLPCDDLWPFKNLQDQPLNFNQPEVNIYWLLDETSYQQVRNEGQRVLLTGMFGDNLYGARNNWLIDLISDGYFVSAIVETVRCLRKAGWQRNWQAGYLQRALAYVLNFMSLRRLTHKESFPDWLTPYSTDILKSRQQTDEFVQEILSKWTAWRSSSEISNAQRQAVDLRHPYRDRRLIEFVLSIPAYQLQRGFSTKYVLRNAMKTLMPDLVRCRRELTTFLPLFSRGLAQERKSIQDRLHNPQADWRTYVKEDWVLRQWNVVPTPSSDGPHVVMPWLCMSYEAWYRFLVSQR